MDSTLLADQTWTRTLDIPLHVEGTTLPEGFYTIVGEVEGSPSIAPPRRSGRTAR